MKMGRGASAVVAAGLVGALCLGAAPVVALAEEVASATAEPAAVAVQAEAPVIGGLEEDADGYAYAMSNLSWHLSANEEVEWASSDPSLMTVDESGNVKGQGLTGDVTITATNEQGASSSVNVRLVGITQVNARIMANDVTHVGGPNYDLTVPLSRGGVVLYQRGFHGDHMVYGFDFDGVMKRTTVFSSNEDVVAAEGTELRFVGAGTATVEVHTWVSDGTNMLSQGQFINVEVVEDESELNELSCMIGVNAIYPDENGIAYAAASCSGQMKSTAPDVSWKSSDESLLTIDPVTGAFEGKGVTGEVTLTATSGVAPAAEYRIQLVSAADAEPVLDGKGLTHADDGTYAFSLSLGSPSAIVGVRATYEGHWVNYLGFEGVTASSSDESVVRVSVGEFGIEFEPVGVGSATVTVNVPTAPFARSAEASVVKVAVTVAAAPTEDEEPADTPDTDATVDDEKVADEGPKVADEKTEGGERIPATGDASGIAAVLTGVAGMGVAGASALLHRRRG